MERKSHQFFVSAFAPPLGAAAIVRAVHKGDPGPAWVRDARLRGLRELGTRQDKDHGLTSPRGSKKPNPG